MRNIVIERTIRMMMIASAAIMAASCGHQGDSSNNSTSSGGGAGSSNDSASGGDNGATNAELGDNDMDSNVAQVDAANGTAVGSPASGNAAANGAP